MIAALLLAAASPCTVANPAACRDTSRLVSTFGFRPMLRRFFARTPAAPLLHRGGTLAAQADEVLGGPPDVPGRIGPLYRFTA